MGQARGTPLTRFSSHFWEMGITDSSVQRQRVWHLRKRGEGTFPELLWPAVAGSETTMVMMTVSTMASLKPYGNLRMEILFSAPSD